MSMIFIAHNIKTEKQLLILKEETENELNKISESFSLHKKRIGRLFFYIFWFPTGFLFSYYFNISNKVLKFDTLIEIITGMFTIFSQLFLLYTIIFSFTNPIIDILASDRNKYRKTLDYIYDYLYYINK